MTQYNLTNQWIVTLKNWIYSILHNTLDESSNLKLFKLHPNECIKELKFLLPIKKKLTSLKIK